MPSQTTKYSSNKVRVLKLITLLVGNCIATCVKFNNSDTMKEPYEQYLFTSLYDLKKLVLTF